MGAGTDGGGASAMGLTSAKRLSAVTGTGEAKLGLGRPKGLKPPPDPPFAPLPAIMSHTLPFRRHEYKQLAMAEYYVHMANSCTPSLRCD